MRRRTEALLVVVGLAFSAFSAQACGSCVGEATPTEKGPPPVSSLSPKAQKLLGTTAKENKGMTLDGTTAESMQKDQ
jgi:hypothetical protein